MNGWMLLKDSLSLVTTALLLLCGAWLCVRLRAFALVFPIRTVRLAFSQEKHIQKTLRAFLLALAGTLGVGNIAGVALAIAYGGPGAMLWMWVCGFFAMFLKYAEVTLALSDRKEGGDGFGYLRRAFGGRGAPLLLFAVALLGTSFSMGAMIQGNAIATATHAMVSISPVLIGGFLALLTFVVIFGGVERISAVTFRLVPLASALYVGMCLAVLFLRRETIADVLARILSSAFEVRAGAGGLFGFLLSRSFRQGGMCGLLSNEAGCGTAPLAHATASAESPAKQGVWGIFEVFVDTMVLCTLTGLSLLLCADVQPEGIVGMGAVSSVFVALFGRAGGWLLLLCVFFFAFATVLCWSFYGTRALSLFSHTEKSRKRYLFAFCLCTGLGAVFAPDFVFSLTDIWLSVMTVLNLWALFCGTERVVELTKSAALIARRANAHEAEPSASRRPPALR